MCFECNREVTTSQRRIDEGEQEGKKNHAARLAEIEELSRHMKACEQARKREEAKPPVQKPQAKNPPKSLEEAEAERQSTRQFLFDETGKPYDEAILEHLAKVAGTV